MDPKRTREALADLRTALEFPTPRLDETSVYLIMPDHILDFIKEFARRWVDLFEECQECGGFGFTWTPRTAISKSVKQPCPSCKGRGFSLNQERLERAAKARYMARALPSTERWEDRLDIDRQMDIQDMEAAILAFLLEGPNADR